MKVKDLPPGIDLDRVPLMIPEHLRDECKLAGLYSPTCFLASGPCAGILGVKQHPDDEHTYPLIAWEEEVSEWDVHPAWVNAHDRRVVF